MDNDFMNKPESPVEVGKLYHSTEYLFDDTVYEVVDVYVKDDKFYAKCRYKDEFDGSEKIDDIYAYYLEGVDTGKV